MHKKKIIIIAAVVVLAIIAAVIFGALRGPRDKDIMELSGNVEVTQPNVGFKIPGRIVELVVDEGGVVKRGDLMAKLDDRELVSLVAQGKAQVLEAQTRLSELIKGSRTQEVEQAKALVNAREADMIRNRKEFDRASRLLPEGAISTSHYDAVKSAYDSSTALHKSALEQLSLVREGPRKEDIEMARHRLEQATAALAISEEKLRDCTLYAPIDGIILKKNVELGEIVQAGVPAFTVGDLKRPWIKVYVKEDKIALVKLGQKAKISVDSYKDKTFSGEVTYISSDAEFTPKTVQTKEERVKLVYGVKVQVRNDNMDLKPGMPADVRISLK